jgi:plasmid stabilization system protein ParE
MSAPLFSFHPAAIEEAHSAARWYHERSPLAATRFVAELNQVIDRILEAPHRWPRSIPECWATQTFAADSMLRRCYATHFIVSFLRFLARSRR